MAAIQFNGSSLQGLYFNGQEVTKAYFNGNVVYEKSASGYTLYHRQKNASNWTLYQTYQTFASLKSGIADVKTSYGTSAFDLKIEYN